MNYISKTNTHRVEESIDLSRSYGPEPAVKPETTPAPARPDSDPAIKPFPFPGEPQPQETPDPNKKFPACSLKFTEDII